MFSVTTDVCVATGDWTSVEADLRGAAGVKGVTNQIEIKPRAGARDQNRKEHGHIGLF